MSETIKERLLLIIDELDLTFPQLERRTGIKSMTWRNLKNTSSRANEEHIEALVRLKPEYALWISSGKEAPEIGQISPKTAETHQKLQRA